MIAGTTDIRLPPVIGSSRQAQGVGSQVLQSAAEEVMAR